MPRGIYREQKLEREKAERTGLTKTKPMDPYRNLRRRQAGSKAELRELEGEDHKYMKFVNEAVLDPAYEADIDRMIDEQMALGKTDDEILAYISGMQSGGQPEEEQGLRQPDRQEYVEVDQEEGESLGSGLLGD